MPIVLTSEQLLSANNLHFEGFFVDTNIVILNQDPFAESNISKNTQRFESVQTSIQSLKSDGYIPYSTIPVILEYYKHIQYNSYTLRLSKKFSTRDFKDAKNNNPDFREYWKAQMEQFKRVFKKTFPLFEVNKNYKNLLNGFNYLDLDLDFGDHLLVNIVSNVKQELKIIYSNDKDFFSLPDDYFLITSDQKILVQAEAENKLYTQKFL